MEITNTSLPAPYSFLNIHLTLVRARATDARASDKRRTSIAQMEKMGDYVLFAARNPITPNIIAAMIAMMPDVVYVSLDATSSSKDST